MSEEFILQESLMKADVFSAAFAHQFVQILQFLLSKNNVRMDAKYG